MQDLAAAPVAAAQDQVAPEEAREQQVRVSQAEHQAEILLAAVAVQGLLVKTQFLAPWVVTVVMVSHPALQEHRSLVLAVAVAALTQVLRAQAVALAAEGRAALTGEFRVQTALLQQTTQEAEAVVRKLEPAAMAALEWSFFATHQRSPLHWAQD
jgi:hypothetical protein